MEELPEERTSKYYTSNFTHLKKRDVKEIFSIFKKTGDTDNVVEIKSINCKFDDWQDFEKNGEKEPKNLFLKMNYGLEFTYQENQDIHLHLYSSATEKEDYAFLKIREILLRRKNNFFSFLVDDRLSNFVMILGLLLFLLLFVATSVFDLPYFINKWYAVTFYIAYFSQALLNILSTRMKTCSINVYNDFDKPSFWNKNKDNIWVSLIGVIFGTVGTLLVIFLAKFLN